MSCMSQRTIPKHYAIIASQFSAKRDLLLDADASSPTDPGRARAPPRPPRRRRTSLQDRKPVGKGILNCTNVYHVTDALWEKLTPSRTSLRSFEAIGLNNPAFQFERIAEFSNISSLNLSNTCVSVDDVIRTLAESLTML